MLSQSKHSYVSCKIGMWEPNMANTRDDKYLRLYHEYAEAIQAYENAISSRTRTRQILRQKAYENSQPRKATEFAAQIKTPLASPTGAPSRAGAKPPTVYLGKILGWVTFREWSPEISNYTESDVDALQMFDNISLNLYWNAKQHYEKCKRAFFDYVRNQNIQIHRQRMVDAMNYAATLQLLGVSGADEHGLDAVYQEVEALCRNVWALYQSAPEPKSGEMVLLLIHSYAESQIVGAEQSSIIELMTLEINRLLAEGTLSLGRAS
jgi:hypothetical protein